MTMLPILRDQGIREGEEDGPALGCLNTDRGHLPLTALKVTARVEGLAAHTDVTQTFVNHLDEPLQATYIFPLPDRAAVTTFEMRVGERVIKALLKERGEARKAYREAISKGHRGSIAEEERPGVFTVRVGNIMPGEKAEVRLTLVGPLEWSAGEATFRFPLVVAPRYVTGTPLSVVQSGSGTADDTDQVPDASRITPPVLLPGYLNPVQLSLAVEVAESGFAPREFRSSLHTVSEESVDGVKRFVLEPGERLNRDFVLRFKVGSDSLRSSVVTQSDVAGTGGTFLLTLVPPEIPQSSSPRDVAFVLDRSGSMSGWKIVAARRAMGRMIDTLTDRDRFTIVGFSTGITTMGPDGQLQLQDGSDRNRYHAVEFLSRLTADGGTEMQEPLEMTLDLLSKGQPGRERILVFITDGQVAGEDVLLKSVSSRIGSTHIYTLGIDRAVNEAFLRRLAGAGSGWSEVVESEDRLDEVMDRVHRRIGQALVRGLRIATEADGLEEVVPARLPDLYAGAPLFIFGRYRIAPGSIAIRGLVEGDAEWNCTIPRTGDESAVATALWARARIRELEDSYASGNREVENEIVATSIRFGALSRFTAYLAVDESEIVNGTAKVVEVTQAVETPDGWDMPMACAIPPAALHVSRLEDASMMMMSERISFNLEIPSFSMRRRARPLHTGDPLVDARALLERLETALQSDGWKKRSLLLLFKDLREIVLQLGHLEADLRTTLLGLAEELRQIREKRSKADTQEVLGRIVIALKRAVGEEQNPPLPPAGGRDFWK